MMMTPPGLTQDEAMEYYRRLAAGMCGGGVDYDEEDDVVERPATPRTPKSSQPRSQQKQTFTCPKCSDNDVVVRWTDTPDVPCWSCGWVPATDE